MFNGRLVWLWWAGSGLGAPTFLSETVRVGAKQKGILVHIKLALMACYVCCILVILNMLFAYLQRGITANKKDLRLLSIRVELGLTHE